MSSSLQFAAQFSLESGNLVLRYDVRNRASRDVYLLNRLYRSVPRWEMSPNLVYIHLEPGAAEVRMSKRIPDLPSGKSVTAPVSPYVSPVRHGESFHEDVVVPLPVSAYEQYPSPAMAPGPRRERVYRYVSFTLGYYWRPEGTVEETRDLQGFPVIVPRTPPGVRLEFGRLESERVRMDIPVSEPGQGAL